jgi:hypothetical protein
MRGTRTKQVVCYRQARANIHRAKSYAAIKPIR